MKIIKNNTLFLIERNKKEGSIIIIDSLNDFMWNKGNTKRILYG